MHWSRSARLRAAALTRTEISAGPGEGSGASWRLSTSGPPCSVMRSARIIGSMARCPVCRKEVGPPAVNRWFPFCSERCKLVDLGKWLGEEYRIPTARADEEDDELPPEAPRRPEGDGGGGDG